MQLPTEQRYALFQTGGKQYQAIPGKTIAIEKIEGEAGTQLTFNTVMFRKTDEGVFEFGAPFVPNAVLKASIVKQDQGAKIIVFRHRRRTKQRTKHGHRQLITVIRIDSI